MSRNHVWDTLEIVLISTEMEILPLDNHLPDSLYNQIKNISDLKVCAQSCGHIEAFRAHFRTINMPKRMHVSLKLKRNTGSSIITVRK